MAEAARQSWSRSENEVVVEAYLRMLAAELRGEPYVKTRANAEVQQLTGRSRTSVEYKFQNVSAVLVDFRHPFVNGYKPASNYQESLADVVAAGLARHVDLDQLAFAAVTAVPDMVWADVTLHLVEAPHGGGRLPHTPSRAAAKRDFVQIENNNARLGLAGELAVLSWEQRRLADLGRPDLAERVEHVSVTKGDGLGYDIRSFAPAGGRRPGPAHGIHLTFRTGRRGSREVVAPLASSQLSVLLFGEWRCDGRRQVAGTALGERMRGM